MAVSTIISDFVLVVISAALFVFTSVDLKENILAKRAKAVIAIGIIFCIASFFCPEFIFPFNALAVIYLIYTDYASAVCLLALFGTVSMIASNESSGYYFFFMIPGIILRTLFKDPKKYFKLGSSLLYYFLSSILIYTALFLIYSVNITPEHIIFPLIGILLNLLVTAIVMPKLAHGFLFKTEENYSNIVDPEYPLLLQLKKSNKYEYKRAIHSAYLSGRCADRIGADIRIARGCAYYHRIGVLSNGDELLAVKTERLVDENDFPSELAYMIKVCAGAKKASLSKEVAIALICDDVISAIIKFIDEKPGESINYDALIDLIFERLSNRPPVMDSDLSLKDLRMIKNKLKEEKLYYDFLR